ncbi:unnamed protein product [Protopolystoma xenopodis]|uniref:Uncharacterized protein n=1 Tax=Protopolystoma xenopodis TaxID=117903 RepID=A0A448WGD2_9PLAT|nr:unnamed protein product [Protopolystoma xenopodis]
MVDLPPTALVSVNAVGIVDKLAREARKWQDPLKKKNAQNLTFWTVEKYKISVSKKPYQSGPRWRKELCLLQIGPSRRIVMVLARVSSQKQVFHSL